MCMCKWIWREGENTRNGVQYTNKIPTAGVDELVSTLWTGSNIGNADKFLITQVMAEDQLNVVLAQYKGSLRRFICSGTEHSYTNLVQVRTGDGENTPHKLHYSTLCGLKTNAGRPRSPFPPSASVRSSWLYLWLHLGKIHRMHVCWYLRYQLIDTSTLQILPSFSPPPYPPPARSMLGLSEHGLP